MQRVVPPERSPRERQSRPSQRGQAVHHLPSELAAPSEAQVVAVSSIPSPLSENVASGSP